MAGRGKIGSAKAGGRQKGTPNKRTLQWEAFTEYCLVGGLERFQEEMNKLKTKDFVHSFLTLLEFHKPKLARSEITGKDGKEFNPIIPEIKVFNTAPPLAKNEDEIKDSGE